MSGFSAPAGGYGRIWEHMYEGSLAGAGPEVFCLMPYIIAKMRISPGVGAVVMLNPDVLGAIFGVVDKEFVERGIEKLCSPDANTKNGAEREGRRLVKVSGHLYLVVNGENYIAIRSKERHADAQARYREKQKAKKGGKSQAQVKAENDGRERRFVDADGKGDLVGADEIAAEGLPVTSRPNKEYESEPPAEMPPWEEVPEDNSEPPHD